MSERSSVATRLDEALDALLSGRQTALGATGPIVDMTLRPLVAVSADLKAALTPPVVSPRFEARLGARLAGAAAGRDPFAWALRHPARLIVTGAVGSAAVGVGITAFAFWRGRHPAGPAHRPLQRQR